MRHLGVKDEKGELDERNREMVHDRFDFRVLDFSFRI